MKVLLDTQAVVWTLLADARLSAPAAKTIANATIQCMISPISHWEIAIKISVGKYRLHGDFETLWKDAMARFLSLEIEPRHTARLISLPFHHKDPFDRLLVCQALVEQVPLISCDATLDQYGIQRIW